MDEKFCKKVYQECSIYPKPTEDEIKEELNRVLKFSQLVDTRCDKDKLVKNISKTLDIKKRMNEDQWIYFET